MDVLQQVAPPFQVRTHGRIYNDGTHSTPGTKQGDVMLTAVVAGAGTYRNSSVRIDVKAGMVGVVPPDDAGILMADAEDPYEHYYCRFRGDYAVHLATAIVQQRRGRFFEASETQVVANLIERMGPRTITNSLPRRMRLKDALLARALVSLLPEVSHVPLLLNKTSLEQHLVDIIAAPTDLSAISDHFGVSRATLCRAVRRDHGTTVQKLHESIKITWATTLLRQRNLNIAEVARRVGYTTPYYFSCVFKRHSGSSPREYRRTAVE